MSCQKLSNSAEKDLLTCGEALPANKVFYQIEESPDQVRAYQVTEQGVLEAIPVTKKGCVITDKDRQTIIRSLDSQRSYVIDPKEGQRPSTLLLTEHGIRNWQLSCPTPKRVTQSLAPESFLSVKSPRNGAIISIALNDQERKTTRFDGPVFPLNAVDSLYRVKFSLVDILTGISPEIECEVELDNTPPRVTLDWQGFEQIETKGVTLGKIARYSAQSFQIEDSDDQAKVEYCSLPYNINTTSLNECPNNQILTAMQGEEITVSSRQGIWQILYRGVDSVGNRQSEWIAAPPVLIEDRIALDQMSLGTERFRFVGEWKAEYLDSLISTLVQGLAQYRGLGTDYERQIAENYLLPYLLKANTTPVIPNRKISLLEIIRPHLSTDSGQSIIEVVEGPGQELVMAVQDGSVQRVLMVDPHTNWVHSRKFEFTDISRYTTATRMGDSIFAFHFRDQLHIVDFSNGKNYSITDVSGIKVSQEQGFIYFIKDGRYHLIDFPSHNTLVIPELSYALATIYRTQNSFYLVGVKAEMQKCPLDLLECQTYGTLSQQLKVSPSKILLSPELGHLFIDGEHCSAYDIVNDIVADIVSWSCKIELLISRQNKTVSLYFQDFAVEKWADYIPATMEIARHSLALDIANAQYDEIGFHSDRYVASGKPQGDFSPMQQQYLFDTHLKKNVFPINGRKIISGDQKWLFRPDRYTFEMDMYYIGEDPVNEVELGLYTEFKHVSTFQNKEFLLEDYEYDHERTLLLDYEGSALVSRNTEMFSSILSAAKNQRKIFQIQLENDTIEIDGDGNLLTSSMQSSFYFIRRNYPIITFSFKNNYYIFDQETEKVYLEQGTSHKTMGHYFKTNLGIQAADGTAAHGKSLGKLGNGTQTYLDHLIKVDGTNLILAIGNFYIKILDANTLNDIVTIPPRNISYWAWFVHSQGQSRQFYVQEEGKAFADKKVSIPYRKRAIFPLDFTMEAQVKNFCQKLRDWRYPGIDKDTMARSCPNGNVAP
jgi:hypothetical protein